MKIHLITIMIDLEKYKELANRAKKDYEEKKASQGITHANAPSSFTQADLRKDVATKSAFDRYKSLQSDYIKKRWYGEESNLAKTEAKKPEKGLIGRTLDVLSAPGRFTTGMVKNVVGQGKESNPFAEGISNLESEDTYGTLLKNAGVSNVAALPMGFLMDVILDPISILSGGATSFVGRIGAGAKAAGLKGAALGAKVGMNKTAATVAGMTPYVNKTDFTKKLLNESVNKEDEFFSLINKDLPTELNAPVWTSDMQNKAADSLKGIVDKVFGEGKGEEVATFFRYDPSKWYKASKFWDEYGSTAQTSKLTGLSDDEFEKVLLEAIKTKPKSPITAEGVAKVNPDLVPIAKGIEDALEALDNLPKNKVIENSTTGTRYSAMYAEAIQDKEFRDIVKRIATGEGYDVTGWKQYDELMARAKQNPFTKKLLDSYATMISVFKSTKISVLNPASMTNAILGNPTMAALAGIDITNPAYIQNWAKAWKFSSGKTDTKFISDLFLAKAKKGDKDYYPWLEYMKENPDTFTAIYGFSPDFFKDKYIAATAINNAFKKGKLVPGLDDEKVIKEIDYLKETFLNKKKTFEQKIVEMEMNTPTPTGFSSILESLKKKKPLTPEEVPFATQIDKESYYTSMVANELRNEGMDNLRAYVANKADSGDPIYKVINLVVNDATTAYERIDQSYKLGLAAHLTVEGVSRGELSRLRRFVNIGEEDLLSMQGYVKGGERRYLLTPDKATELAGIIYMNYNAMPAFVKFMRNLPLLGSPFFSFMYAMGGKTAESMFKNPAMFNKVNYLIDELNGDTSPTEKAALQSPYNTYLQAEGMVRLPFPFLDGNPLYVNTVNWMPYYMNNIFSGSQRDYESGTVGGLTEIMDSLPIAQDPMGQMIFNYFIQPMILGGEIPRGRFGQQLYPTDATMAEKIGYGLRDVGETFTPSAVSVLSPITPEGADEWLPSYHWRRISRAMKGQSIIGAETKDPAAERLIKAMSSFAGVPAYSPNLEYVKTEVNRNK